MPMGFIQRLRLRLNIADSSLARLSSKFSTHCTRPAPNVTAKGLELHAEDAPWTATGAAVMSATALGFSPVSKDGFGCVKCGHIFDIPERRDDHERWFHHFDRWRASAPPSAEFIGGLPTEDAARKRLKLYTYIMEYFPDALIAELEVAVKGNEQHNPGEPLHWAREKSSDQMNTAFRHQFDYGRGVKKDTDGQWHLAKAIWRLKAQLQLDIEEERRNANV